MVWILLEESSSLDIVGTPRECLVDDGIGA